MVVLAVTLVAGALGASTASAGSAGMRSSSPLPRSAVSCGGDQLTGPIEQLSNTTVSGTIIQGCLPQIFEQSSTGGSVNTCLVWTFWLALPSGGDAAILVASPAAGSLQGAGIKPTDRAAVQNEETLAQALSDLMSGQHVKTTVELTGPEVYCGYNDPNQVTSATLSAPQLKATLRNLLKPSGGQANRRAIDNAGGYTFRFSPPFAGKLLIRWSAIVRGKRTLIASASQQLSGATSQRVEIKLTKAGKTLLKTSSPMVTGTATFVPIDGIATSSKATFVLKK